MSSPERKVVPKDPGPPGSARSPLRISFHWKFFLLLALLGSAALLAAYLFAASRLEQRYLADVERALLRDAGIVEEALLSRKGDLDPAWVDPLADRLGASLGARVSVIDRDGRVLGDSALERGRLPPGGERPQGAGARPAGEQAGTFLQRGGPGEPAVMQVVRAITGGPGRGGRIRLSLPLLSMAEIRYGLRGDILRMEAVLLLVSLILSALLTRRAREDLGALARATHQFGRGEFGASLPKGRQDEIGDLARGLDSMGQRLRRAISEVTEERNQLQAILGAMGDGVLVTDDEGRVLLANPALIDLLDLPGDPQGKLLLELVRSPELHDVIMQMLRSGSAQSREIALRRGEKERHLLTRVVGIGEAEKPSGAVAVLHDISEVRQVEKMRRDFAANVSHELKTPLAAVRGYAETLAQSPPEDPAKFKSFSETIFKHAERLNALVEDLLELSKIESGQATLEIEPVPLDASVERVVQAVTPTARRRRISLRVRIPSPFPPLRADAAALETAIGNLVENGVKYAPEGGWVEIRARRLNGMARIEVADSGPGIPPEHLPRLFERFYRVDASRSREQGGTGLGLAIVKHLAQALGGQVGVESDVGVGSVFHLTLPVDDGASRP